MRSACLSIAILCASVSATPANAQQPGAGAAAKPAGAESAATSSVPDGYVIGAGDVLVVLFYGQQPTGDVVVRPDGKISLPLLNDVDAAGQTPDQLRASLVKAAVKYIKEPDATVIVKEIHSRNVFIQGQVAKPNSYPLLNQMDVMQLISQAGGLLEYANRKNIRIIRTENGKQQYFDFNWDEVVDQKRPEQNITLKPGDQVIVR